MILQMQYSEEHYNLAQVTDTDLSGTNSFCLVDPSLIFY